MKKKLISLLVLFLFCFSIKLFAEEGPISSGCWKYPEGTILNGRSFTDVAESYREQNGWAYIEGQGKVHVWLYDTRTYFHGDDPWNFDSENIEVDTDKDLVVFFKNYVPSWIEKMGYSIDLKNIVIESSDNLDSVCSLMELRGCDISIWLEKTPSLTAVSIFYFRRGGVKGYSKGPVIIPLID